MTVAQISIELQQGEFFTEDTQRAGLIALAAMLLSFAFIRFSTRMIRAEVSWWPGNVTPGGLHIHHLVFGIVLMMLAGFLAFAIQPSSPWIEILAGLFGIGVGLTLDEFALWLYLEDVYWSEEGRRSIDAIIVALILGGGFDRLRWQHLAIPAAVRRLFPDVYHDTKNALPIGLGVPAVVTVHDLAYHTVPRTFGTWSRMFLRSATRHAVVRGVARLSGAPVRAHDVRAGAALVLLPETWAAIRAARADRLQSSMNLAIGSALAPNLFLQRRSDRLRPVSSPP